MTLAPLVFAAALAALPARDPAARKSSVEQSSTEVLKQDRYKFCHDPEYPLYVDEAGWCKLAGDPNPRCPDFPTACRGGAVGHKQRGDKALDEKYAKGEPEEERFVRMPMLGGIGQVLLWVLILGGLGAIAFALYKVLGEPGEDDAPEEKRADDALPPLAAAQARGPIETDVERLLALARAASDRGDHARALDFLYAALLRRLDGDGLIKIRPWRTNGDYLRDLRARPDLKPEVAAIVREIERVQFGARDATGDLFHALHARVLPLVGRSLAAMILALIFLTGTSCMHGRGDPDSAPSGQHAVLELLDKQGFEPRQRLTPLAKIGDDEDETIVILPGARVDAAEWDALIAWAKKGHALVVASGAKHLPAALAVEVRDSEAPDQPGRVDPAWRGELGDLRVEVPEHRRLRTLGDGPRTIVSRGDAIYAVEVPLEDGVAIVLADDYLFTNAMLTTADDAAFLVGLLDRFERKIELADEATGQAAQNPVASVGRGKLLPFTLQLGFVLLLFFVFRGAAFGALRDPPASSRRAFVDHVRALGAHYAKARAARHALALYATHVLDRVRESARLGGGSLSRVAEAVAQRTRRPLGEVMRLLVEAQEAKKPRDRLDAHTHAEDLALMRELGQLMKDVGGNREHR